MVRTYKNTDVQRVKYKNNLYELKFQAHKYFDMLWELKYIERNELYLRLSEWLGVAESKAHMSKMNIKECKQVIEYSVMMLNDMRRLDLDFGAEIRHPYFEIITT